MMKRFFSNRAFVMGQGVKKRFYKENNDFLFILCCSLYYLVRATVHTDTSTIYYQMQILNKSNI